VRKSLSVAVFGGLLAVSALAGCGGGDSGTEGGGGDDGKIVLGFSQVGAESGWRTANTESIKASAAAAGIELKFSDAQGKQENQISDIRGFITQRSTSSPSRRWSPPAGTRCSRRPRTPASR
jgi:ABC-type sugar transport system substrate-binding protein